MAPPFKVISGGNDQDQEHDDGDPPGGEPPIDLGDVKPRSVYVYGVPYRAGISRLKWYAAIRRYSLKEVLSALFDLAADNPELLDDYLVKYKKAREQKAEKSAS